MAETDVSNGLDVRNDIKISDISSLNMNETVLPPITNTYSNYDQSGSWMFSSHDIPILIGAAAGAIGLIIIFLLAALVWHCCQFALQRQKSSYSLDNESERNSVSSRGSNLYINNPIESSIIFDEKSIVREISDQNLKRSISAPIHRDNTSLQTNTQKSILKSNDLMTTNTRHDNHCDNSYTNIDRKDESISLGMELNEKQSDKNEINLNRSLMYVTNQSNNSDINSLKSRSLPWNQSNKRRTVTIDDDSEQITPKINYSKKRKNRMRNDSAAAIALNKSGTDPKHKIIHSHKDTDTLVDNEAIVVYDERTAL